MAAAAGRRRRAGPASAAAPTWSARTLRVLGAQAYAEDPLRPLRLVRLAAELGFAPDERDRAADRRRRAAA